MRDLETAKRRLNENSLTLSIVKDGEALFETSSHGISGFLEAIEKLGDRVHAASIADRVVGKAIGLLCVYAMVKEVYAVTLSREAEDELSKHAIHHEWEELVESILDVGMVDMCPFEKLAMDISDPKDAYVRLKALQDSLHRKRRTQMKDEHEQFISKEEAELKSIREKKLKELTQLKTRKEEVAMEPVHVTDSDFNEILCKHSLALIDCWAPWCGPCVALTPTIEQLATEYAGRIFVGKLNVDENPNTAECFQIFSIPTMLVMKKGKEVDRIVGLVPKKHIESVLKKHLE
jgi:thioredoxin 1